MNNAPPTVATAASATPNPVAGTSTALSVLGADDGGESNLTYTWVTTGTPPAPVSFNANGTNGSKNTTATFTKAGNYSFQVTITDAGGLSTTSTVNVTVAQTLTAISVSPASATLNENATQQFTATAYDQFGTALSTQPSFTWALAGGVGSVNAYGLYTAPGSTGSASVSATSGTVSGTGAVTVNNAPPTVATAASATPNPVAGTSIALSVLGADDGGESNLTYTWVTTGTPPATVSFNANGTNGSKNTTATFTKAGNYSFQVTIADAGGLSTTSTVNVTVAQTLTSIAVSPASATVNENATQQFTATAYDQFSNALSTQPSFTWALAGGVGSVNAYGLYTAPGSTGSASVSATSGTVSGTGAVTVNNAPPTVATAASATPNPVAGTTTALSVLGADDGGEANLTYTWVTTGTPPASVSFSANGTNGSKNTTATFTKAGNYGFQVTIADAGGLSTTSTVNVTVAQTLTSIIVSPASATLNENATQQFTATAYDQFGNALTMQPSFTWALAGGGSVNASGLYTAPGNMGSASILATSGAVSGSAAVTVTLILVPPLPDPAPVVPVPSPAPAPPTVGPALPPGSSLIPVAPNQPLRHRHRRSRLLRRSVHRPQNPSRTSRGRRAWCRNRPWKFHCPARAMRRPGPTSRRDSASRPAQLGAKGQAGAGRSWPGKPAVERSQHHGPEVDVTSRHAGIGGRNGCDGEHRFHRGLRDLDAAQRHAGDELARADARLAAHRPARRAQPGRRLRKRRRAGNPGNHRR